MKLVPSRRGCFVLLALASAVAVGSSAPLRDVKTPGKEYVNSLKMKMVRIEPGSFRMGSPKGEKGRDDDETPHKVTLTKGYYLSATLVTQWQWEQVLGKDANRSEFMGKDDEEKKKLPVDNVSWDDCQEFCKKLSAREGRKYTLPTEAQWEYACRAGTTTPFWCGETISTDQANYDGNDVYGAGKKGVYRERPTPVEAFKANPWGLHDMHGNLWQWCEDRYAPYPEDDIKDPVNLTKGESACVLRGGSWHHYPRSCRAAFRFRNAPDSRYFFIGCRLAVRLD